MLPGLKHVDEFDPRWTLLWDLGMYSTDKSDAGYLEMLAVIALITT